MAGFGEETASRWLHSFFTKLSVFDICQKWNADAPHANLLDKRGFLFF